MFGGGAAHFRQLVPIRQKLDRSRDKRIVIDGNTSPGNAIDDQFFGPAGVGPQDRSSHAHRLGADEGKAFAKLGSSKASAAW